MSLNRIMEPHSQEKITLINTHSLKFQRILFKKIKKKQNIKKLIFSILWKLLGFMKKILKQKL